MKHRIIPAIMSGGAGSRLWPASTESAPKQFHALTGPNALFVDTLKRVCGTIGEIEFAPPLILSGAKHAEAVRGHLAEAGVAAGAIVLEPMGRNTAAAAAAAAAVAREIAPGALVLLLPADHVITDHDGFIAAVSRAAAHAHERIVTFGIAPDRPDTGYGYIKRGGAIGAGVFEIGAFKEKPDAATAQSYLDDGGYSWNAGMFLFHPDVLMEEFAAHAPAIRDGALAALAAGARSGQSVLLNEAAFAATPSLPLDIAVMEKTARGAVAPCNIGWADVGSWSEIWRLSAQDDQGNAAHGAVVTLDAQNNLIRGDGVKVCVAGVSDLIVVATRDAVIVLPRARAQDVKTLKELAEKLR